MNIPDMELTHRGRVTVKEPVMPDRPNLDELERRARWAIETLGAENMDGISAVNFAREVLALLAEARKVP